MRSIDIIREAALILRDELKSTSFGLENKYSDAYDLRDFWCKWKIKDNTEDFLAILLNLKRIAIDDDDNSNSKGADIENLIVDSDDDSEDKSYENESCKKVTKNVHAYSLFQMMVHTLNNGKVKTPLHVMTGRQFTSVVVVEVLLQAKLEFQSAIMKFEGPVHCFLYHSKCKNENNSTPVTSEQAHKLDLYLEHLMNMDMNMKEQIVSIRN